MGSHAQPQCQGCACHWHGSMARHSLALRQPCAGKQRLPSPPTGDAQPKVSGAPSAAHSSQALTDRQTNVGRL